MSALADVAPLWVTARASGIAALLAASLALSAGLLMALKPRWIAARRLELRAAHEALALATVAFIAVHAVSLFLDPVLDAGPTQILVPFGATYEPLGTALGQLAAYGMIGLGLTFYARRRLGSRRWRSAHRLIPLPWGLAVVHGLLVGTDADRWWTLAALAPPVLAGGALLVQRWGPAALAALDAPPPTPHSR